jgi:N-acetylneuraminic acid mutarotase
VTSNTGTKISSVVSPYVLNNLTNGTIYYFVVTAVNTIGGDGPDSVQLSGTPPVWLANIQGMPTGRSDLAVGVVNGILYAVGGYSSTSASVLATVEAYNPSTKSWTTKASMPTARSGLAVGVVNGILYAVGGNDTCCTLNRRISTLEAYDPSTNTWTTKAPMPTSRMDLAVGVVNGILYAVGGLGTGSYLVTIESYDPSTNTWTTKASMSTERYGLSIGVINGILYAVGGDAGTYWGLGTVEAYDPSTNSWTTKASMPTSRLGLAVGMVNGILYAVGGVKNNPGGGLSYLANVEAFNPSTNTWTTVVSMPTARSYLAAGVVNGVLYAVGGWNGGGSNFTTYLTTVEMLGS